MIIIRESMTEKGELLNISSSLEAGVGNRQEVMSELAGFVSYDIRAGHIRFHEHSGKAAFQVWGEMVKEYRHFHKSENKKQALVDKIERNFSRGGE